MKNIPLFKVFMAPTVDRSLSEILHSGYIGQGKKVEEFEVLLSEFLNNSNIVTVNSGTSALHLALHMINVEGGYVISTPLTCTATNFPILANRGKILWADIDPNTGNISVSSIKELLNKYQNQVKAIVMVHWGGYPCDIDAIRELASCFNIPAIEDAAHAFGSSYKHNLIGTHSDYTCFSFQAIKHITSVDGGLLACTSQKNYERAKLIRWYGIDRENVDSRKDLRCEDDIKEYGFKFHMNDVNASIGIENLKYAHNILMSHRSNASFYKMKLKNIEGVTLLEDSPDRNSSYWLFTLKVKNRDSFMKMMKENGVMTSKVHARNDMSTATKDFKRDLPNLNAFVEEMVCIPVGYHVSVEDREYIVDAIKKGW